MKAVLDTNVLVSGLIRPNSIPGKLLKQIESGEIQLVVDERVIKEFSEVLIRPKFSKYFTVERALELLGLILDEATIVQCEIEVADLPDEKDIPFLETAFIASVPLVTGNLKHFPTGKRQGVEVLSPSEFLKKYL